MEAAQTKELDASTVGGPQEVQALMKRAEAVSAGTSSAVAISLGKPDALRFKALVSDDQVASGARLLDDNQPVKLASYWQNKPVSSKFRNASVCSGLSDFCDFFGWKNSRFWKSIRA